MIITYQLEYLNLYVQIMKLLCVMLTIPESFLSLLDLQAVKKIGLVGLFTRGLPLRIVMIGTLTGAQWGLYDSFKVFVGL